MYVRWSMDTARSISYRKASFSVEWRNICAAFKQSQFELFAYVHTALCKFRLQVDRVVVLASRDAHWKRRFIKIYIFAIGSRARHSDFN